MTDATERVIEAAVSPLADNAEMAIAARKLLKEQISQVREEDGDTLEVVAARMESYGRNPWEKYWRHALYWICGIVTALVFGYFIYSAVQFSRLTSLSMVGKTPYLFLESGNFTEKILSQGLTPEQKLLLFGDTRRVGSADQFKPLWDGDPENPAYFSEYISACVRRNHDFPPDFTDLAKKIDPDNAFFPLMKAAQAAKLAIDPYAIDPSISKTEKSPKGLKIKRILDQEKLDETISLIHQAAKMDRYESYQMEMLKKRIPLLPKQTDVLSQIIAPDYIAAADTPSLWLLRLAHVVSAKSIQLAKNNDAEGFRSLLMDWESVRNTYLRSNQVFLIDTEMAKSLIANSLKPMLEAATDLRLTEEARRLKALDDRFEQRKSQITTRPNPNDGMVFRGSYWSSIGGDTASRILLNPQKIPDAELRPGRLADHAFAEKTMALIGSLLLCHIAGGASLHRYRGSKLSRQVSLSFVNLLRGVDWLWIFCGGLIAPVLWYGFVTRCTHWSGREWSLMASHFIVPGGQFMCMLSLMILLPILLCRWRLKLRGGAVGLSDGRQRWGWAMALSGVLALPLFSLSFHGAQLQKWPMIAAAGALGMPLCYIVAVGMRALVMRGRWPLRRHTMARALFPAYVLGILIMMAIASLSYIEEKSWVSQDRLMQVTVDAPSMTRYEYELTQLYRKELLEMMDQKQ
jgi:hypothetical protein